MRNWKGYEDIIKQYKYIVVYRPNFNIDINRENILYYKPKKTNDISSTLIRNLLREETNLKNYIDKDVYKYIKDNKLYNT